MKQIAAASAAIVLACAGAHAQTLSALTGPHPAYLPNGKLLQPGQPARPPGRASSPVAVTTYHYDNLRTGWNPYETTFTDYNVQNLQLLHAVPLDGQVDAQPLVVPGVNLGSAGTHDVVYVVTENDTVYGIDANSGAVLIKNHIGTPVPQSVLPGRCDNNDSHIGITSTPVIDQAAGLIYVMGYVYKNNVPSYVLHVLYLNTLLDRFTPRVVAAAAKLSNGATYNFDPTVERQRPALLLASGNLYATFGSFCDAGNSRGWVLGWHTSTMQPFGADYLTNQNPTAPGNRFLTSIWMSGFGPAADPSGSIYFSTSNAQTDGTAWNYPYNLEESVVKYAGNLAGAQDFYTPDDADWGQKQEDSVDDDFGAGGVMLLPKQYGVPTNFAVAGGKQTGVLLLNRDALGGYGDAQIDQHYVGDCWCGVAYFTDSQGFGHVIEPGGNAATIYTVQVWPKYSLFQPRSTPPLNSGQDGGFFPTVSTNGLVAGTTLMWSVSRPVNTKPATVTLYVNEAFTGAPMKQLAAGTWPVPDADADIVPTVANGHVYVGSYHQLTIFGFANQPTHETILHPEPPAERALPPDMPHEITGLVVARTRDTLTLRLRTGATLTADVSRARGELAHSAAVNQAFHLDGDYDSAGVFHALVLRHAKPQTALWVRDR